MYPPMYQRGCQPFAEASEWKNMTLCQWFFSHFVKYSDSIAIQDEEVKLSYTNFLNEIELRASYFVSLGISKDNRVTLRLCNKVEFFICFFALINIGAIPVLSLQAHCINEVSSAIKDSESVAYIGHYSDAPSELLIIDYLESCKNLACVLLDTLPDRLSMLDCFHSLAPECKDNFTGIKPVINISEPEEVAFILLSGGTTGRSKLIPRTHSDYIYNVEMMAKHCCLNEKTRYLAALPVAHNFALGCPGVLGVLANGGTVYLGDSKNILSLVTAVDNYSITHTALVPSLVDMFVESKNLGIANFSSLRQIQVGGAYFAPDKARNLIDVIGCELQQVFGMSEGLLCCSKKGDSLEQIVNSQGSPASPYDMVRIVSPDFEDVALGDVGQLLVKGPYTIRGYLFNTQANERDFTSDGWFITGDLAKIRFDGCIQIMGRAKEQINRFGEKFSPTDVEDILRKDEPVIQSCLISVPCEVQGEKTVLFVVKQSDLTADYVRNRLVENNIPSYKIPDEFKFISAFPLTPVNKIDRNKLAKTYKEY